MYYDGVEDHFLILGSAVRPSLELTHDKPSLTKGN